MIAITVILVAVTASFVLGLGPSDSSSPPQASFAFDYDAGPELGVRRPDGHARRRGHDRGLYIRGESIASTSTSGSGLSSGDYDIGTSDTAWGSVSGSPTEITAGNRVDVGVADDYEVRVVYESSTGERSATLGQDSGPEA